MATGFVLRATRFDDGSEVPALNVFTRWNWTVLHFRGGEMTEGDPYQISRDAPDLPRLSSLLDRTPGGRGTDWHPSLTY